jgi:Icc-related predicted phosphoesterase
MRDENNYAASDWAWPKQDFFHSSTEDLLGVKDISYGADIVGQYVFIGYPSSTFPRAVQSDAYRRHRRWLDNAFRTFEWKKHSDKDIVFVCHNGPHDTNTNLMTADDADERARGEHYGSKLARRSIERYQPRLCVHGHIEEGRGQAEIGETAVVNVGEGRSGSYGVSVINRTVSTTLKCA